MDSNSVNKWLTLGANFGVLVGLIVVVLELQQSQQIASAEQDIRRVEINIAYRNQLIDQFDVWAKGNAGEPLDSASQEIYEYLIETTWSRTNAMAIARTRVEGTVGTGVSDFAAFLYNNPGARETWLRIEAEERALREIMGTTPRPEGSLNYNAVLNFLESLDKSGISASN